MTQLNLHLLELIAARMAHEFYTHTGQHQHAEVWGKAANAYAKIYALALDIHWGGK